MIKLKHWPLPLLAPFCKAAPSGRIFIAHKRPTCPPALPTLGVARWQRCKSALLTMSSGSALLIHSSVRW